MQLRRISAALLLALTLAMPSLGRPDSGRKFNDGLRFEPGVGVGDMLKRTGPKTLGTVTTISELLIVPAHTLSTFAHDSGVHEKGETVNAFNLSWAYNRNGDNPTSQTIDQGIGSRPVADRSYPVVGAGLTTDTTYTISAIGDDTNPSQLSATVYFRNKRYWCAINDATPTDAEVVANCSSEFGTARQASKVFDASQGTPPNYLHFVYPVAWGAPSGTLFNGFNFTEYTVQTIVNFTNASGYDEDYYDVVTNNTYSGAGITWEIQ